MTTTATANTEVKSITGNWFIAKATFDKMLESGMQKKVTEAYLFDALSYTEAEANINKELQPFITGDFTIADIRRMVLAEIFLNETGDRYYKVKAFFLTLDEKTGAEKKKPEAFLVQASNIEDAIKTFKAGMGSSLADYSIAAVTETPIMDVFPFKADENKPTQTTSKA